LERADVDLDFESAAGILQISFDRRQQDHHHRQTPNREIWLAARAGGFHFRLRTANGAALETQGTVRRALGVRLTAGGRSGRFDPLSQFGLP